MYYRPIPKCILKGLFIGNMGNPSITRLGKTQMWYKNYHSNFQYSNIFKKAFTFENLLNLFFKYGLHYQNNLKLHNFWYKNKTKVQNQNIIQKFNMNKISLYFRKFNYAHSTLAIEHSYFLRIQTPEFFPLRLYIMKYSNWLILSVQWFKPLKNTTNRRKVGLNQSINKSVIYKRNWLSHKTPVNNRVKLISFFLKKHIKSFLPLKYCF